MKTALTVSALAIAATATVACSPVGMDGDAPIRSEASTTTTREWTPTQTYEPVTFSPFDGDDGFYLVGQDIEPGTYKLTSTRVNRTGYVALCADYACQITMGDGGLLYNDAYENITYVEVTPDIFAVKSSGSIWTAVK